MTDDTLRTRIRDIAHGVLVKPFGHAPTAARFCAEEIACAVIAELQLVEEAGLVYGRIRDYVDAEEPRTVVSDNTYRYVTPWREADDE